MNFTYICIYFKKHFLIISWGLNRVSR